MKKAWIGVLASLALPLTGCQAGGTWYPAPYGTSAYIFFVEKSFDITDLYGSADFREATKFRVDGSLKFLDGYQPVQVWSPSLNIFPKDEWGKEAVDFTDGTYTVTVPRWGVAFTGGPVND